MVGICGLPPSSPPILSEEPPSDLHAVVEEGTAMLVLGIPDVGRHFVSVVGHELREHRARGGQVDDPWPAVLHHDVDLPFDALAHAVVTCIEVHADLAAEAHRLQKGRDPRGTEDLHEVDASKSNLNHTVQQPLYVRRRHKRDSYDFS